MKLRELESASSTFIIAEVGQAHDGSLGILHSLVEAAAEAGADAVKFQVHIAEAESSAVEPFRVAFSYEDKNRFNYWKRMGFSKAQWSGIKRKCDSLGVEFLATPFSNAAVDLLEDMGVIRYKVGSGDVTNELLLRRLGMTGKEVILSTGLVTYDELANAVRILGRHSVEFAILQCTTKYPTQAEDIGLQEISHLKEQFGCPVGLSDHSGEIYPAIAAVALKASIVETHITFDKKMFGPDSKASLTVSQFAELVRAIRFTEKACSMSPGKKLDNNKHELRRIFGRSLAVNRDMKEGEMVELKDLEAKKPEGQGISLGSLNSVIGRKLRVSKRRWEFVSEEDLV